MPFRQADDFFTLEVIFMELVNKLRANIKRWRVLPLTMTVRVNPIKMVSLLTLLLYLLVATSHTESLRPIYTSPVGWEALGFFFLRLYYWAANSGAFVYWKCIDQSSDASNEDIPLWVLLETSVVKNASSYSLLFSSAAITDRLLVSPYMSHYGITILLCLLSWMRC